MIELFSGVGEINLYEVFMNNNNNNIYYNNIEKYIYIYEKTLESANRKLHEIYLLNKDNTVKYVKGESESILITLSQSFYKTVIINDGVRGLRWDYAYIDENINIRELNNIILPSMSINGGDYEYY